MASWQASGQLRAEQASMGDYLLKFLAPTLIGNTVGSTALAALLNQTRPRAN